MFFKKMRNWQILAPLAVMVMMLALIVPVVGADDTFDVTVYHKINGKSAGAILAGDPATFTKELPVDVYVNGGLVWEDFKFGEMQKAELPAGEYTIKVTLANQPIEDAIMTLGPTPIPAGVDVVITAKLINQTPTLAVKVK